MKLMKKSLLLFILMIFLGTTVLAGCGNAAEQGNESETPQETAPADEPTEPVEVPEEEEVTPEEVTEVSYPVNTSPKEVIIYFSNWAVYTRGALGEVASIPWDNITYINHAFWSVAPADGTTESSFDRRDSGAEPRTEFEIISTDPDADYLDETPSEMDGSLPKNHFAQYEYYAEQYPDVNIMISLGGWTESGYFSEMAYTEEGRQTFIDSCVALIEEYPWIDGIDVDWEYPAGNPDGERLPENADDQGCPIWGTAEEDNANFALMLKGLREALDAQYGAGNKKMTACASASYGYTLPCQDWVAAEPYLDYINIMTYDFAGTWAGVTSHNSSITDTVSAVAFLMGKNIPTAKLNIGSPLYGMDLKMTAVNPEVIVGASIEAVRPSAVEIDQSMIIDFMSQSVSGYTVKLENGRAVKEADFDNGGTGWHFDYSDSAKAPYLYNDDEGSEYYGWFISYE
ncbi:MAG: hypothetical protein LBV33_02415, partial [Lachnospiraceae bacterium]|nr:hypothetical protein [Lachnospiraceae bacterium]